MDTLKLVAPALALEEAFCRMSDDYQVHDPEGGEDYIAGAGDFEGYVAKLTKESLGIDLPSGYVPQSTLWLTDINNAIVGISRLRHFLTPALETVGGHIGCDVPPSCRGRGYGTVLLRETLKKAAEMKITRVFMTADQKNIASCRVIEKNKGVLSGTNVDPHTNEVQNLYWISL